MVNIYPPKPGGTHMSLKVILAVLSQEKPVSDLVQAIAGRGSYLTIFVNDCLLALELTREIVPDLLLLDYKLLHPRGIAFIQQLRSHKALADVPTLVINTPTTSRELPFGGPLDIYLTKLSNTDELASAVQSLIA